MNIKILTSYHKKCELISSDIITPIQVGTDLNGCIYPEYLHDNIGENISHKNRMYCELTAQYWAWKNLDADYYGFMHYRRYFDFGHDTADCNRAGDIVLPRPDTAVIDKLNLSDDKLEALVGQYDVITASPYGAPELKPSSTVYEHYKNCHNIKDLDTVLDIIAKKYPEFQSAADEYFNGSTSYYGNMYIMKKDVFFDYCKWLFDILEEHEKCSCFYEYDQYQYRVSGFLAERLWGIYLLWLKQSKGTKILEVPVCLFGNTDEDEHISPAFPDNNVPIVFAASNSYAPYLAVALKSLTEHISSERNYDILVLHTDICQENIARIKRDIVRTPNVSLRFKSLAPLFAKRNQTDLRTIKESNYCFFIPEIMCDYDKVVYLDSDLIILDDIAKLYDVLMGENMLAAVRDADSAGCVNGYCTEYREHITEKLKLDILFDYFNSGVLLMNLAQLRKNYTTADFLRVASDNTDYSAQDTLNILCANNVELLDMAWNVLSNWIGDSDCRMNAIQCAPHWISLSYMQSRNVPKIVHYAGWQKPWDYFDCDFAEYFWEYARKTVYYEALFAHTYSESIRRERRGAKYIGNRKVNGMNIPIYADGICTKLLSTFDRIFPNRLYRRKLVVTILLKLIH